MKRPFPTETWTCTPRPGVYLGQRVRGGTPATRGEGGEPLSARALDGALPPPPLTSYVHHTARGGFFAYRGAAAPARPAVSSEVCARAAPSLPATLAAVGRDARVGLHPLPWQRFAPVTEQDFVGNAKARTVVEKWLAAQRCEEPRPLKEAMLMLCGDVGSGKTCAATWALRVAGYNVQAFDGTSGEQLLSFLRRVAARDLSGRRSAVLLDDVDELLAECPQAAKVLVHFPVLGTARSKPRGLAGQGVVFYGMLPGTAKALLQRLRPDLREPAISRIVEAAHGDYRQLCVQAAMSCSAVGGSDELQMPYAAARRALSGRSPGKQDGCSFTDDAIRWNFGSCCRGTQEDLETYASFQASCCSVETWAWTTSEASASLASLLPALAASLVPRALDERSAFLDAPRSTTSGVAAAVSTTACAPEERLQKALLLSHARFSRARTPALEARRG